MTFKTEAEAVKRKLVRMTQWLQDSGDNRSFIEKSGAQIMENPLRKIMYVKASDTRISLFADNVASTTQRKYTEVIGPKRRWLSESKKFNSIRHLAESLFSKNPKITPEEFQKAVRKEYPASEAAGIKCYGHFCVYRNDLLVKGRFQCIPKPDWFGKESA